MQQKRHLPNSILNDHNFSNYNIMDSDFHTILAEVPSIRTVTKAPPAANAAAIPYAGPHWS